MTIDGLVEYFEAGNDDQRRLAAEVRRLRDENAYLENLFALQHSRVGELQELWLKATGRQGFIPDLGNLSVWATGEIIRLRERERVLVEALEYYARGCTDFGDLARSALEAVKEYG